MEWWALEMGKARKQFKDHYESVQDDEKSPLHSLSWFRIVLDEAHYVKERTNSTAKAVHALKAKHRWALSGA